MSFDAAFEGGELRAAFAPATGGVVTDPFHPTRRLVELLRAAAGPDVPRRRAPVLRRLVAVRAWALKSRTEATPRRGRRARSPAGR